jgi:hypothetical protein
MYCFDAIARIRRSCPLTVRRDVDNGRCPDEFCAPPDRKATPGAGRATPAFRSFFENESNLPHTMKALFPGGLMSADAPTGWTLFLFPYSP